MHCCSHKLSLAFSWTHKRGELWKLTNRVSLLSWSSSQLIRTKCLPKWANYIINSHQSVETVSLDASSLFNFDLIFEIFFLCRSHARSRMCVDGHHTLNGMCHNWCKQWCVRYSYDKNQTDPSLIYFFVIFIFFSSSSTNRGKNASVAFIIGYLLVTCDAWNWANYYYTA